MDGPVCLRTSKGPVPAATSRPLLRLISARRDRLRDERGGDGHPGGPEHRGCGATGPAAAHAVGEAGAGDPPGERRHGTRTCEPLCTCSPATPSLTSHALAYLPRSTATLPCCFAQSPPSLSHPLSLSPSLPPSLSPHSQDTVNRNAFLIWWRSGRPMGADFGDQSRRELVAEIRAGRDVRGLVEQVDADYVRAWEEHQAAQRRAEEERRKAEEARRVEEEARRREEQERRRAEEARRAEEEGRRVQEEGRRKAEEARRVEEGRRVEEEGRRKAEDEKRKAEEGTRKAEDGKEKEKEKRRGRRKAEAAPTAQAADATVEDVPEVRDGVAECVCGGGGLGTVKVTDGSDGAFQPAPGCLVTRLRECAHNPRSVP